MALNVFLTFFYQYGPTEFLALEKYYLVFNYGVPAIPSIVFVLLQTEERGRVFGNATVSFPHPPLSILSFSIYTLLKANMSPSFMWLIAF